MQHRVLSGIQPSGSQHIGHLVGALAFMDKEATRQFGACFLVMLATGATRGR